MYHGRCRAVLSTRASLRLSVTGASEATISPLNGRVGSMHVFRQGTATFRIIYVLLHFPFAADVFCVSARKKDKRAHTSRLFVLQVGMLLVLGDSFVRRMAGRPSAYNAQITFLGRSGARIQDETFRRWAIQEVAYKRPAAVLLVIGGNDLARPQFRQRQLLAAFAELTAGLLAAGAGVVFMLAIPPRTACRPQDASVGQHRARRKLANLALRQRFRVEPVRCLPGPYPDGFLGPDGVHPSEAGWRWLTEVVRGCSQA